LLRVLALVAALAVNVVQTKNDRPDGHRFTHGAQLAEYYRTPARRAGDGVWRGCLERCLERGAGVWSGSM